ncbi:Uncharacterized protein M6B38_211170 [Iris pallida]|uniref:Fungal lipase-type domain-containing protein n=1 Tax=Iris pallida TaxID=29817 RepID=A0AAX6E4F6_IRIPA|nr:Uncharacterized protein M6B38_211170 [Iris pallida]
MALNLDTFLRSRFLSVGRLPLMRKSTLHDFDNGSYLKLRCHVQDRPLVCTDVPPMTISTTDMNTATDTDSDTDTKEPLYMDTFSDYLDIDPEEMTEEELFRLLKDGKVDEIESIGCPEGTVIESVERRRMLLVSVALQKLILAMATPGVGNDLKMMNLLAQSTDIPRLVFDYFTGKLVLPDPNSRDFKSPFAFFDTRVELDNNIKPGDSRYYAHLSIMAAKLAYENEARIRSIVRGIWDMEFIGFYDCWEDFQEAFCTQAFMMSDKPVESGDVELVVVAFRGTNDAYDACTDIDFSWYEIPGMGKVHGGFMKALGLQKEGWPKHVEQEPQAPSAYYTIREKLRDILGKNKKARFLVTGHSLGGALSAIFPMILKYHGEEAILDRLEGVYTFGQPRVGDEKLGRFAERLLDGPRRRYFRFVYGNDLVPRVPFDDNTFLFRHFGKCLYYDSLYRGRELDKVPNHNYFSNEHFMHMYLNAAWELVRSFGIGYVRGPEYEESPMMRMMRAMGLMIPGMPCHSPQDYNNVTRLGTVTWSASDK